MRVSWIVKGLVLLVLSAAVFGTAGWFAWRLLGPQVPAAEREAAANEPPPDPGLPVFQEAMKLVDARQLPEAQAALAAFLEHYPWSPRGTDARAALGQVNTDLFFSATPTPDKVRYEVRPGDALSKIEQRFKTNRELLMRSNNLDDPTRLRVGQVLLISQPEFSLQLNRKAKTVTLWNRGRFFKEYRAVEWTLPALPKAENTKVTGKSAWRGSARVAFGSKDYVGSDRWVETALKGCTLYTEGGKKPSQGVSLPPPDMEELSTLLDKGVPVKVQ